MTAAGDDDTLPSHRSPRAAPTDDALDDATHVARRRSAPDGTHAADPDDGSTVVARRESRRRAASAAESAAAGERDGGRSPLPAGERRDRPSPPNVYPRRTVPPVNGEREAVVPHGRQEPVDTRAAAARVRRHRRRVLTGVIAGIVAILVIAGILAVLALTWS